MNFDGLQQRVDIFATALFSEMTVDALSDLRARKPAAPALIPERR
jgi:hypothetical protein